MRIKRMFTAIDTHVNGRPARTITGGLPYIPGATVKDKSDYLSRHADWIRKTIIGEPRGSDKYVGVIITEPCDSSADSGIVCMDQEGYANITDESIIGVSTAMIESGLVNLVEPYTYICLESVNGMIRIKARIEDENVKEIAFKHSIEKDIEKASGDSGYEKEVVVEEVKGRAFITGMYTLVIDPEDPLQHGIQ